MANMLIVDDDDLLQELLSEYVTTIGNLSLAAGSLQRAFELTEEKPIDLVFLDVRLSDGNGLDALPRFRELPSVPEVIIVTGMGTPSWAEDRDSASVWTSWQRPPAPMRML